MSEIKIKRRIRITTVTLATATGSCLTLRLDDMAGAVISFGTMNTNSSSLQMWGSHAEFGEFRQVYDSAGAAANITLAPSSTVGRIYSLPDAVFALPYLKIVSGATNSTGTVGVVSFKS